MRSVSAVAGLISSRTAAGGGGAVGGAGAGGGAGAAFAEQPLLAEFLELVRGDADSLQVHRAAFQLGKVGQGGEMVGGLPDGRDRFLQVALEIGAISRRRLPVDRGRADR